jgi:hypothetical protein
MDSTAYRLSRIYGEGWRAAKEMLLHPHDDRHAKPIAPENPHQALEERARWSKGFEDALRSRTGAQCASHTRAWDASRRAVGLRLPRDVKP